MRDESILEAIPAQPPAEDLAAGIAEQLPVLIARVSPASRAVLVLHYLHEMPLTEVAAVLGIALGTAKSRLAYGLHSLRRAVNEQRGSDVESCRQKAKT